MFALNIKTAAAPPQDGTAPPPPGAVVDVDGDDNNDDSFVSTPSTHSSGRRGPAAGAAVPPSPRTPEPPVEVDHDGYPHCPIFIPSKGRSDLDRSTMAVLVRDLVPFILVVEQEEAEAYSAMLDRLVGQHYGFADMTYAAGSTTELDADADGVKGDAAAARAASAAAPAPVAVDLWPFPCACCTASAASGAHPVLAGRAALSADALQALAQRLCSAFHHGYTFTPPVHTDAAEGSEGRTLMPASARRASPAFELHDVDSVRALFKIEVLPETNRGVSYVRNYILQVLVPRMIVGCGVDRTGNVEELCLCRPGEHPTLTSAALRMAALEPDIYSALDDRLATDSFLDERRASTRSAPAADGDSGNTSNSTNSSATPTPAQSPSPSTAPPPQRSAAARDSPRLLHGLFGFYWVLDDDIYGFYRSHGADSKNELVSARAMLREVEARLLRLRRNADIATLPPPSVPPPAIQAGAAAAGGNGSGPLGAGSSSSASASSFVMPPQSQQQQQQQPVIFTCKEDALMHNYVPSGASRLPTMRNYNCYYTTACFSLEYNRFALDAAADVLSVNSYNNIACLFNYALLHNPPQMRYFPPGVPNVRRPEDALVGYLGHSMLWYRFAVREDYDFTLQLIARGLYTLRFRSLAFDVPQMMKVRGGMTDYYRNCHDEIRQQNDRFVLQWPAVAQHWVKGKEGNRRNDIRVRWDLLSPARARYPGAFLYLSSALPQLQAQRPIEQGGATAAGGDETAEGPGPFATTAATAPVPAAEAETRKRARPTSPPASPLAGTGALASPRPYAPPADVLARGGAAREWKGGYVVERWRDISSAEAREHAGLVALSHDDIHIGRTVAVIPPFFTQQPSVVRATVIERAAMPVEAHADGSEAQQQPATRVMWTAVAQDVRGMPFLHVETCYEVPAGGTEAAAARIDRFFDSEEANRDD